MRSRSGAKANVAAFDRKDAEAVRRRRATANRVLTYLKAALNHAWRAGIVPSDDAWRRVKPFKSVDAPVIRYLSRDEITRLLNGCQGSFRANFPRLTESQADIRRRVLVSAMFKKLPASA